MSYGVYELTVAGATLPFTPPKGSNIVYCGLSQDTLGEIHRVVTRLNYLHYEGTAVPDNERNR